MLYNHNHEVHSCCSLGTKLKKRLKREGTSWACPIINGQYRFLLRNIFKHFSLRALMNTTQVRRDLPVCKLCSLSTVCAVMKSVWAQLGCKGQSETVGTCNIQINPNFLLKPVQVVDTLSVSLVFLSGSCFLGSLLFS